MDTIDGMRTFITVVSEGSFSGAAEHLVMSPQLVSKYVGQLETRLKVRLLNRSTRTLSITEAGQAYYDRCRQVLADIDEMEGAVGELTVKARGTLRINAPIFIDVQVLESAGSDSATIICSPESDDSITSVTPLELPEHLLRYIKQPGDEV